MFNELSFLGFFKKKAGNRMQKAYAYYSGKLMLKVKGTMRNA